MAKRKKIKIHKNCKGNASQFFVAGELCRRGYNAVVTMGNCPNTDVLCSNLDGTRFAHIQVKTFPYGKKSCIVGMKAEENRGRSFFWVLVGLPAIDAKDKPEFYIVPSRAMSINVRAGFRRWVNGRGKKNKKRNPENTIRTVSLTDFKEFHSKWALIENKLK
jgi:hypothetical protein